MEQTTAKRGVGRPRKEIASIGLNFRVEVDLLGWLDANKGDKSRTQFINDIIRKTAKL